MRNLLSTVFILIFSIGFSQNQLVIDSLKQHFNTIVKTKGEKKLSCEDVGLLNTIASKFFEHDNDSALYYYDKSIKYSKIKECNKNLAFAYIFFGRCLNYKSEFVQAIDYYNKAENIYLEIKDDEKLSDVYFNIAESYMMLNNLPRALDNLNKTKSLCEKNDDSIGIAQAYNYYAILYYKQGNRDLEKSSYDKALEILKNNNSQESESLKRVLNFNLGLYFRDKKEFKKALPIFLNVYNYQAEKNSVRRFNTASTLGDIYTELGFFSEANYYLNIALKGSLKSENSSILADTYRRYGNFYFKHKNYEKAIEFTNKGLKLSEEIGELESVKFALQNLATYYEQIKDYKNAFESHEKYKKVYDSIFNEKIDSEMKQMQLDFELQQQQQKFNLEKKSKDLVIEEQAKSKKALWYSFIVTILLLCSVIFAVYQNLKNTRKQKADIENSLEEKNVLLKEIHHRVKNNLQIVTSLLNIQADGINDDKVIKAIKEGQSRVQMMSLLHQNLYQSKKLNNIDVNKYIEELTSYLKQIFIGDSNRIAIHLEMDKVRFDFDTAVPLGLILNELISNAFNHAFKAKDKGNIWIKLTSINHLDYKLDVTNDGEKLPYDFDIDKTNSMGVKLVQILARQLRGKLNIKQGNGATSFIISFKDLKLYQGLQKIKND